MEQLEDRRLLSTFHVDNTSDGGPGSLRQAILDADGPGNSGSTIEFEFVSGTSPFVISVVSGDLPALSQPTTIENTLSQVVQIDGGSQASNGLTLGSGSDGSTIQGLEITDFVVAGISLQSSNNTIGGTTASARNVVSGNGTGIVDDAGFNLILGNFIGTDISGQTAFGNGDGIDLEAGHDTIGGTAADARNVISGNRFTGLSISEGSHNLVAGNFIGTDVTGEKALSNGLNGMSTGSGSSNAIGYTSAGAGAGNVISGNRGDGIFLSGGSLDIVSGNVIGMDVAAKAAIPNSRSGVSISSGSNDWIGGKTSAAGNVISGNRGSGIMISGGAHDIVSGNVIGAAVTTGVFTNTHTIPIPNSRTGVAVRGGSSDAIGRTKSGAGAGNVISGNRSNGIFIYGGAHDIVSGNEIGTDRAGQRAIANGETGVVISGGSNDWIGGKTSAAGNTISGNGRDGIYIYAGAHDVVSGNHIGVGELVGPSGTSFPLKVPNSLTGIIVNYGESDTIGRTKSGAGVGNVISDNGGEGIFLSYGMHDIVSGNDIGVNRTGELQAPNVLSGVEIGSGLSDLIGGKTSAAGNVISGNRLKGIYIDDGAFDIVSGNEIGTDRAGETAIANGEAGVVISGGSNDWIGGKTSAAGNVISGNVGPGIYINGGAHDLVSGNEIGTNRASNSPIANGGDGVDIIGGSHDQIGGKTNGAGNVISGNRGNGIYINSGAHDIVSGNDIGIHRTGTGVTGSSSTLEPNYGAGVSLSQGSSNTIGRTKSGAGAGNAISGNRLAGVLIREGSHDIVSGNEIGAFFVNGSSISGPNMHSNGGGGVAILNGSSDRIGGTAAGAGNVISGNRGDGIYIEGGAHDLVSGNVIGLDPAGGNSFRNTGTGLVIVSSTSDRIGGTMAGARNVISGNRGAGILIFDAALDLVLGNFIGTNASGEEAIGNGKTGVSIEIGTSDRIGGTTAGAGNVISGNRGNGVYILYGSLDIVAGNDIGTDVTGEHNIGNAKTGVQISQGSHDSIGGTKAGARNVISGNGGDGIYVSGESLNLITGNFIGTDVTGEHNIGNGKTGVQIVNEATGAIRGTQSGGRAVVVRNVISGNRGDGIHIMSGSLDLITGNFIGTDVTGENSIGNGKTGVSIDSGKSDRIGGETSGARNVVSGNGGDGIHIAGGSLDLVLGNRIGTNVTGENPIGNAKTGVSIASGMRDQIGGTTAGAHNVISGNRGDGIYISRGSLNVVAGNDIGTNVMGNAAIANATGIQLTGGAASNVIGGLTTKPGTGAGNVISGNSGAGILVGASAISNLIVGNLIGTNATGLGAVPNEAQVDGIDLAGASHNTIGGSGAGAQNVISGNTRSGIGLDDGANHNQILGNFIGMDVTGEVAIPNSNGVDLEVGATSNSIGGLTATPGTGAGNVISGNAVSGIGLNAGADGNLIVGNLIGTDLTGDVAKANATGIELQTDALSNTIGGTAAGAGDVISGNKGDGIRLSAGANDNSILGDEIGTNAAGLDPLPNNGDGVDLEGASSNIIGGTAPGAPNVISGNVGSGILFNVGAEQNVVEGNLIGTGRSGETMLGNGTDGVDVLAGSYDNTIGGSTSAAGNVISDNGGSGIILNFPAGDQVEGNLIGTDRDGTRALANKGDGIDVQGAGEPVTGVVVGNTIGGTAPGARNVIWGNLGSGIRLTAGATGNLILNNQIGTGVTSLDALPSQSLGQGDGIDLAGASANTIGGLLAGAGNVISGNLGNGIGLSAGADSNVIRGNVISVNGMNGLSLDTASNSNVILENMIGTNADGEDPMGNGLSGIAIDSSTSNTVGGLSAGDANVISDNAGSGILLNAAANSNQILGNRIGTDADGEQPLGNSIGININSSSYNAVGGTAAGAGNVISGNSLAGIQITNSLSSGNLVEGNQIGTNAAGTAALMLPDLTSGSPIGVSINDSPSNTIGGTEAGAGNVLAGFAIAVNVTGTSATGNAIQGNGIGTNQEGDALPDVTIGIGIYINGSAGNSVGGTGGAGNTIMGYADYGVYLFATTSSGDVIQGNQIGEPVTIAQLTAKDPTKQLVGIAVQGGSNNLIGGTATGDGNTLTGNANAGIYIFGQGNSASNNKIENNVVNNNLYGILLYDAPSNGQYSTLLRTNRFGKNSIANVREFTGSVPSLSKTSRKASKEAHEKGHHDIHPRPLRYHVLKSETGRKAGYHRVEIRAGLRGAEEK
ncbi:MAG: NosD domain-containing protein [Isosphaeraceae bacterium]